MTFGNRKFLGFLGAATVVIVAEYVLVLSDSVIAGNVLGKTALGAMNLLMPVFSSVSFFTWMLAVGTSIVYSDALARTERDRAARLAGQGLAASVLLGLALLVATWALKRPYLSFMASDAATTAFAQAYWAWYPLVVLLEAVDLLLLYLVYTDGGDVHCLFSYVGQVVVNIGLSYALCTGAWGLPALGMSGIALGTVFAYVTGVAFLLPRLWSPSCSIRFRFAFLPRAFFRSLKASFGDASAGLFHALLFFVVNWYVLRRWGPDLLPVVAIVFCIVRLTVFFNGVGIALQPLETVYHGEGNETGVARLVRFAAVVSVAEGVLLSAFVLLSPETLIALFGIGDPELGDPELIAAARHAARLTVTGLTGYAVAYMLNSHYQYVGRPDRSIALTALAFLVLPVALIFLLGTSVGTDGIWIAVAAGPACALAAYLPLLKRTPRKTWPTLMWTLDADGADRLEAVRRDLRRSLAVRAGDPFARRVDDVFVRALRRIGELNPRPPRVEASVLFGADAVTLILRDDGGLLAIDGLDVALTHLPTTGFNRNIITFPLTAPASTANGDAEPLRSSQT